MNNVNRVEPELIIKNETKISEQMQFYIDYANKLFYPDVIEVCSGTHIGRHVYVASRRFANSNDYRYCVQFDHNGLFQMGWTYFCHKGSKDVLDQNEFKAMIKREIYKVNVVHGTINKLLSR